MLIRFFIYLNVGAILGGLYKNYAIKPWRAFPSQYDLRKLQNHAPYLVEGLGGLSVLLGQDENVIREKWGAPDYRDYGAPETLRYFTSRFFGEFLMLNGRVHEIRFLVRPKTSESLRWYTALGLYADEFDNLSNEEQKRNHILNIYKPLEYSSTSETLTIFTRGIRFHFKKGIIHRIDIFYPRWKPTP